jgi:hypothetical protein
LTQVTQTNVVSIDTATGQLYYQTAGSSTNLPFNKNRTTAGETSTIYQYESIFNHANLLILSSSIFIVEEDANYYVLGDLINSGSLVVNGTLKVGGTLYNAGTITGTGIIE